MATFSIEPNDRVTFKIRYEDPSLLVVDKPAKIVTQPGLAHDRSSLLNGLFAAYGQQLQNLGKARDFGLLHRLDRDTSGLLIIALKASAYDALREDFTQRRIRKFYWAVCKGGFTKASGVINKPILEIQAARKIAKISSTGKPAITAYRILEGNDAAALVECRPVTGRLHQVRVHMAAIGHAILGDEDYAKDNLQGLSHRVALHAHRLAFTHPDTGKPIDIRSPWPSDLRPVLKRVGLHKPETGAAPKAADD
jgi:RluA family pseudouridine synthase